VNVKSEILKNVGVGRVEKRRGPRKPCQRIAKNASGSEQDSVGLGGGQSKWPLGGQKCV